MPHIFVWLLAVDGHTGGYTSHYSSMLESSAAPASTVNASPTSESLLRWYGYLVYIPSSTQIVCMDHYRC